MARGALQLEAKATVKPGGFLGQVERGRQWIISDRNAVFILEWLGIRRPEPGRGAKYGAGDETRTRDIFLGKEVLYQLSYARNSEN
jgi:hypothetical protein